MARTREELEAICAECVEIEKEGGDVLAYLQSCGYIYTPGATWYNLQKQILGRSILFLTDGKPKHKKGAKNMEEKTKRVRRNNTSELAKEVAEAMIAGTDPLEYLASIGYKGAEVKWYKLKRVLREENPELLKEAEEALKPGGEEEDFDEVPSEAQKGPQKLAEEKMKNPSSEVLSHTLPVAQDTPAVVSDDARCTTEQTESDLEVYAVRSKVRRGARYEAKEFSNTPVMTLVWYDQVAYAERSLSLEVKEWKVLLEEIPKALKALGLS